MPLIKQAHPTPVLVIMATIWVNTIGPTQTCLEEHHFLIRIILEVVILPQIQIEIILERQQILLNKIEISIIIVGTVLQAKITEMIIFPSLIMRLVSKGTTMLPRASLAQARPSGNGFVQNGVYQRRESVNPPSTGAYKSGRSQGGNVQEGTRKVRTVAIVPKEMQGRSNENSSILSNSESEISNLANNVETINNQGN